MIDQRLLVQQINEYQPIAIRDILTDNEHYALHDVQVAVVSSTDDDTLQEVANLLAQAGGGLLPRSIDQLRNYTEQGAMFVVRARVDGEPEPRIIFTFSVEPGHTVSAVSETDFPIYERGAMAISPDIKHHGLALPLLREIYAAIPELSQLFLLITSINPSVWFNNLATGMVPVAIDENDPLIEELITWTCVCGNHVTGDVPPGQVSSDSLPRNDQIHGCAKRLNIGDQIVYPINRDGRFIMGSDIIFITRGMYNLFRTAGARMADVSLNLYDALAADPRLQNQADPNNAYRVARLGELWQTLQTNLSNSES